MRAQDVRGAWERRHRDVRKSDFRVDLVRESPHLGPIGHRDAGNVTLSGPPEALCGPFPAGFEGRERAVDFDPPTGDPESTARMSVLDNTGGSVEFTASL
jgi:hypothetical protein